MAVSIREDARRDHSDRAWRAIFEISKATAVALDAGRIGDVSADHIRLLFHVDIVALWLWDEARAALVRAASSRSDGIQLSAGGLQARAGLAWRAYTAGRPVMTRDYARCRFSIPSVVASGMKVGLAAPLLSGQRPVGAVAL